MINQLYFNNENVKRDLLKAIESETTSLATANHIKVFEHLLNTRDKNIDVRKRVNGYVLQFSKVHSDRISGTFSAPSTVKMSRK